MYVCLSLATVVKLLRRKKRRNLFLRQIRPASLLAARKVLREEVERRFHGFSSFSVASAPVVSSPGGALGLTASGVSEYSSAKIPMSFSCRWRVDPEDVLFDDRRSRNNLPNVVWLFVMVFVVATVLGEGVPIQSEPQDRHPASSQHRGPVRTTPRVVLTSTSVRPSRSNKGANVSSCHAANHPQVLNLLDFSLFLPARWTIFPLTIVCGLAKNYVHTTMLKK
jgi:hypothetical protein